jgi:hypothetical protein
MQKGINMPLVDRVGRVHLVGRSTWYCRSKFAFPQRCSPAISVGRHDGRPRNGREGLEGVVGIDLGTTNSVVAVRLLQKY